MLFGLQFQPPEFSVLLHGTVQAIMLGAFAAIIPKITAERIREKEEGLALDEAYEAGLLDDDEDDDEFGYAGGYVCATCDNSNEVGRARGWRFRARLGSLLSAVFVSVCVLRTPVGVSYGVVSLLLIAATGAPGMLILLVAWVRPRFAVELLAISLVNCYRLRFALS